MKIDLSDISVKIYARQERIAAGRTTQHIWFAWYPVRTGYLRWAFMENVARQYDGYQPHNPNWFTRRYWKPSYENMDQAILRKLMKKSNG